SFIQPFHDNLQNKFSLILFLLFYQYMPAASNYPQLKGFYVNCWGEIKISLQFITLVGFHSGGNFSLFAGGCCVSSGLRLAVFYLGLCYRCGVIISLVVIGCVCVYIC